jgi:hypothetical protein
MDSRRGNEFSPFSTATRPDSDAYRPSLLVIKRPGRELGQSPPYIAEVKNDWSCTSAPPSRICSWRGQGRFFKIKLCFFHEM